MADSGKGRTRSYIYAVYAHTLASNIALMWPQPSRSIQADITFAWKPPNFAFSHKLAWLHHWFDRDGTNWLASARAGNGYLLRLPGLADFWLSLDGREVCGVPGRAFRPELLDQLLINHILPFALTFKGLHAFHASASRIGDRAVLFLGDTGAGKSTLAAGMLARGFPPLADDCSVVACRNGSASVLPSHPTLRLWPQVKAAIQGRSERLALVDGKYTVRLKGPRNFPARPAALSRIYVLCPQANSSTAPALEPLTGPKAVVELVRHSYRLDFSDRPLLTRQLKGFGKLADSIAVRRLVYSPDRQDAEATIALVLSELKS